jgi:hypothetical protein
MLLSNAPMGRFFSVSSIVASIIIPDFGYECAYGRGNSATG